MMKVVLFAALVALVFGSSIPATFDARDQWKQCNFFILNQESCGSCWDFCAQESFADRLCINGEAPSGTIMSPEPILECSKQGCDGGFPSTSWNWVIDNGGNTVCTDQCFSGCASYTSGNGTTGKCPNPVETCDDGSAWSEVYQAGSFKSLSGLFNQDLNLYQTELMNNGPLQACFTVFENFYTFFARHPDGIYTSTDGANIGGHCVKLVGWGEENGTAYWTYANSWDTTWGNNGYFKMQRGVNLCGNERQVSEGFTAAQAARLGEVKGIHPNVKAIEKPVGAWHEQADPSTQITADAAIAGLERVSEMLNRPFTLKSILSAETQVVAGVNFKILAQTVEGEVISMKINRNLKNEYRVMEHKLV